MTITNKNDTGTVTISFPTQFLTQPENGVEVRKEAFQVPDDRTAWIIAEGVPTPDGRMIRDGALTWRDPIPLMFTDKSVHGMGFEEPSQLVGQVVNLARRKRDGANWIAGEVVWDEPGEDENEARETVSRARRLLDDDMLASLSADLAVEAWSETEDLLIVESGVIVGVTLVPMPAMDDAEIASVAPVRPPAAWFANPRLDGPTPMKVTADGRVYGHLAPWAGAHRTRAVSPPRSPSGYAEFLLGETVCDDGSSARTGPLTMNGSHLWDLKAGADRARAHYDHTGTIFARVNVGEDAYGIWFAGALLPDVGEEQAERVRAAGQLSGDWRATPGGLDLVAALLVNTPAYPIYRRAGVQDRELAMVAALPVGSLEYRIEGLELLLETTRQALPKALTRLRADEIVGGVT